MATITELQTDLASYKAARDKILLGQEYSIGNRKLRRPDLAVIERTIRELEHRIAMLGNDGKINTVTAVFGGRRG